MLKSFLAEFLGYCKILSLAQNSIKDLIRYIRQLDEYLVKNGPAQLSQLQYKHLFNFVVSTEAAPTTVKARIWALKKYFAFLHLHEYIKDNIAKDLNPPKIPKKETKFLSEDELKIVIKYVAGNLNSNFGWRDFLVILLMAALGFRKASVVLLDKEDFEPQNNRIFIKEKGCDGKRPIYIPLAILLIIQEYIYRFNIKDGPLFLNNRKKRLKPDCVNKILNNIKKQLLADGHSFAMNLHPHIFRHSAGTQLNEAAGFSITKEMLGHRNAQNTRKYIHLSPTAYGEYMKRHPYFKTKEI